MKASKIRIDLHTHSSGSPDGSLTLQDYRQALSTNLDYIAITDHDTIATATEIQSVIGPAIIVGQEITTSQGELIGLYLTQEIPIGVSPREAVERIRQQGGLVYLPHPYEQLQRHGMNQSAINQIIEDVDIIETYNSRTISLLARRKAVTLATTHQIAQAGSSDAHGKKGLGRTATVINKPPTKQNLVELLQRGRITQRPLSIGALLEPSRNRRAKMADNE
jgi:predicted metal-dependent phosphoesterase TrpH